MSSSPSVTQREQQQQQQQRPWTFSAYHTTVLTNLVNMLQAEVRRQQDAYDHAMEVLHASADPGPSSDILDLGVPLYATREEQVQVLRDTYALATLDTGGLVALGPYRLLHTLKAHITRIEDERRAGAVAAGNGTGGRKVHPDRAADVLKSETSVDTTAQRRCKGGQSSQCRGVTPSPLRIKTERSENDAGYDGVAQQHQPSLSKSPSPPSGSLSLIAATSTQMPAKMEHHRNKGATVHSTGDAGAGRSGDSCPPSWMTLMKEAAKRSLPAENNYNGAYFIPFPTPTGSPLARYVSSSIFSRASGDATQLSTTSWSLPTLVAPVDPGTRVRDHSRKRKRAAARSSQASKRCRSVSASQASVVAVEEMPLLSQAQQSKITRLQEHMRFPCQAPRSSSPPTPTKDNLTEDHLLRLWLRVWPRPSSMSVADAEECGRRPQRGTTTPPFAPHACIRPTPAMVTALTRLAELNYKRDCEQNMAQREYLATLLSTSAFPRVSGAAADAAVTGKPARATSETSVESTPRPEALQHLHDELVRKRAQLDGAYAERMALFQELTEALRDASAVCVEGATADGAGEARRPPLPFRMSYTQRSAVSPSGSREKSQRPNTHGPATGAPTAIEAEVVDADGNGEKKAVVDLPTRSAAKPASALALLHTTLNDPTLLLRQVRKAREALAFFPTDMDSSAAVLESRPHDASEETWDLPNGIVSIDLPPVEHDRDAPELREYLWPEDLDARIRHELRGFVSSKSHSPKASSVHVVLSAAQVRRLEETACAVSTVDPTSELGTVVPPVVGGSVVAHPRFVKFGWLYVHGRGETIVSNVELN
ncbi:hypothetical protein JKF63_05805 [Porcisia hertigi]|uniref:Uncharacterized protein n=1 Tax=Porcisia hertigi TaxID=2761500 RepID=A0A836I856_9TRYP|nr:hypothetical protein JKF63_05805 [Porcisia hertigi]